MKEQAMQRAINQAWFPMLTFGLILALNDHASAQRAPEPTPINDNVTVESELPLPLQPSEAAPNAGSVGPAFLGVTFEPRVRNAAVARSVAPGSPAYLSGMMPGDTIVSVNGQEINHYDEVLQTVSAMRPGDILDLELSRRVTLETQVVLDSQPDAGIPVRTQRVAGEQLPAPANYEQPPNRDLPRRADSAFMRPRENPNAPQQRDAPPRRTNNADRDDDSDDRRGLFRGRLFRRRG
jgi:hypothetical protein